MAEQEVAAVAARAVRPDRTGVAAGAGQRGAVVEPQAPAALAQRPAAPDGAVIEARPDPTELLGLDRLQVAKLLGQPSLLMEEPPAEVWLYKGRECVLHVFLYQQAPSPDYAVRHYELRGAGDAPVAQEVCYASLLGQAAAPIR